MSEQMIGQLAAVLGAILVLAGIAWLLIFLPILGVILLILAGLASLIFGLVVILG